MPCSRVTSPSTTTTIRQRILRCATFWHSGQGRTPMPSTGFSASLLCSGTSGYATITGQRPSPWPSPTATRFTTLAPKHRQPLPSRPSSTDWVRRTSRQDRGTYPTTTSPSRKSPTDGLVKHAPSSSHRLPSFLSASWSTRTRGSTKSNSPSARTVPVARPFRTARPSPVKTKSSLSPTSAWT